MGGKYVLFWGETIWNPPVDVKDFLQGFPLMAEATESGRLDNLFEGPLLKTHDALAPAGWREARALAGKEQKYLIQDINPLLCPKL